MVDEETQTVYFTRAGEVSGDVVYASVWRLPTVGIDVFYLPSNLNPRPLTQRACEIARALGRVVGQVYKHIYRQHMFIQYARYFSRTFIEFPGLAFNQYPDAKPTALIPDVPCFEYYMERVAVPQYWMCEDIAKIFDAPDLKLYILE